MMTVCRMENSFLIHDPLPQRKVSPGAGREMKGWEQVGRGGTRAGMEGVALRMACTHTC